MHRERQSCIGSGPLLDEGKASIQIVIICRANVHNETRRLSSIDSNGAGLGSNVEQSTRSLEIIPESLDRYNYRFE